MRNEMQDSITHKSRHTHGDEEGGQIPHDLLPQQRNNADPDQGDQADNQNSSKANTVC